MVYNRFESTILFLGDIAVFYVSLWLMLAIRYTEFPTRGLFENHFFPFTLLFGVWLIVYYIAGLYDKDITLFKKKLVRVVLKTQITNTVFAVTFFYFIPYFGITPKTNLFIYLAVSLVLILAWRIYGKSFVSGNTKKNALIIGGDDEIQNIMKEGKRFNINFISSINPDDLVGMDIQKEIVPMIYTESVELIAVDLRNRNILPLLPHLYNFIFSNVRFVDMYKLYEEMFDRIPLSTLEYNWFLENISARPHFAYDALKRIIDILLAVVLGVFALILVPFVWIGIKIQDGGKVFIVQKRIGQNNEVIRLVKYRTMTGDDGGKWIGTEDNRHTPFGKFLRKTRIDELPQLWNVIKGDISLIGPRPDILDLGRQLEQDIPFYTIRNIIKPGLSGWAQIKQNKPPQSLEETKMRLSYDLYYIKNRSFLLDIRIALKTIKTLLSREGM